MYYLGYLFAVAIGGFAAWMMYKTMSTNKEFADKPMVAISFSIITFIIVFIIAMTIYQYVIKNNITIIYLSSV